VNVEKAVSERTAKIAQFKKVIRQYGIDTKEGKKAMAGYEAFKKDLIGSLTSADMQVGSILMDDVGGFNLSKDPEDRTDQYTIKMVANKQGVTEPDFSDDGRMFVDPDDGKKKAIGPWQREQAEKRVDESIEVHVPDVETGTRQFSPYSYGGGGGDKKDKSKTLYIESMKFGLNDPGVLQSLIGRDLTNRGKIMQVIPSGEGEREGVRIIIKPFAKDSRAYPVDLDFEGKTQEERAILGLQFLRDVDYSVAKAEWDKGKKLVNEGETPTGETAKGEVNLVSLTAPASTQEADTEKFKEFKDNFKDNVMKSSDVANTFIPYIKKMITDELSVKRNFRDIGLEAKDDDDVVTFRLPYNISSKVAEDILIKEGIENPTKEEIESQQKKGLTMKLTGNRYWVNDEDIGVYLKKIEDFINTYIQQAGGTVSLNASKRK
jgi:hypothetical protein